MPDTTDTLKRGPQPARPAQPAAPAADAPGAGASIRSETGAPDSRRQLETIALSAVRLAALGPQLAELAGRMEEQADRQAGHAAQIAGATGRLSQRLDAVVARLREASGSVHDVMEEIARIADQTRILSINASIEAGRAGEHGRAFAVVAREVQTLADRTRDSTRAIEERVQAIEGSVREVAATAGNAAADTGPDAAQPAETVRAVNEQVQAMARTAGTQRDGAQSLHALGGRTNRLTEELLLAVGSFRLGAHTRAAEDAADFLPELGRRLPDRAALEAGLAGWLATHPGFDLLYVTDAAGRQIVENIGWKDGRPAVIGGALGSSWAERPWFAGARRAAGEVVVSDIYRSKTTGEFCFTVSAALRDPRGAVAGVFGADVNFQKLLTGAGDRRAGAAAAVS